MATFVEVEDAILGWCASVSGREIVLENDDEDFVPRTPYVSVLLTTSTVPNSARSVLSNDGMTETVFSSAVITAKINTVGGDAQQAASRLTLSLKSMLRHQDLWVIMGYGEASDITNLTGLEVGAMRERREFTVTFNTGLQETFDANYFNEIEITVNEQTKPSTETRTITGA